jgi:DNA modification methylase
VGHFEEQRLADFSEFLSSMHTRAPVQGLTHDFYFYPARFSPLFARAVIDLFSQPGDLVLDPFVGGGTTLVEALVLGRYAFGTDINPLAVFVAKAKTTPLSAMDLRAISEWCASLAKRLNLHLPPIRAQDWYKAGYQKHLPWPIRKTIELILGHVGELKKQSQQQFVRCALLRATQRALDCKEAIPTATYFRECFFECLETMMQGMRVFSEAVERSWSGLRSFRRGLCLCLNRSAIGLEAATEIGLIRKKPRLVVTSPPYPGVHVVYHRWQVQGRRETPAPFWIVNSLDGNGESFYTFVNRKRRDLTDYFDRTYEAFKSVRAVIADDGLMVQLVGFSDPPSQLPKYLKTVSAAGFKEVPLKRLIGREYQRIWRNVPNRKWYAHQRGRTAASKEVVLFHKPT